jgi:hypothetical protein
VRFLLAAAPLYGHVGPLAAIGGELRRRGHHVTLLTGGAYSGLAADAGLHFRHLPAEAAGVVAQGTRHRTRLLNGRDEILDAFVRPLPAQHDALDTAIHRDGPWDALLCDAAFLGALPLLLTRDRGERPAIYGVSVTPLSLVSVDCAPFGSALQPGHTQWSRMRNRQIHWLLRHGPLRVVRRELDAALARYRVPPGRLDFFDHAGQFDLTFHLGSADFEYPRREMPPSVRFVGPLPPRPQVRHLPEWWDDLRHLPVVHVTQGTLDNHDLGKLIGPTVRALADDPVLTVVTTAGRPESAVCEAIGGPLPGNVRLAGYLPYEQLLPRTAVLVSNGGYGGVCGMACRWSSPETRRTNPRLPPAYAASAPGSTSAPADPHLVASAEPCAGCCTIRLTATTLRSYASRSWRWAILGPPSQTPSRNSSEPAR